ncbi:MAG: hypothetical protein B7C24_16760 [Bacteroidetes bacterium 4572_77]|nr:MAG: hypothetical protein B7C24_16760 [Bacteroidetes bacterium 4572_77]
MKKVVIFGLMLFLANVMLYAQPKLVIMGGDTYDWGPTAPKSLRATIKIKNEGDKDLYISKIKPSCGCTTAPIDKNTIAPGDHGTIKLILNLDNNSTGNIKKIVKIFSNDPRSPEKILNLVCKIVKPIYIKPYSYLKFNDAAVGVASTCELTVENRTKEVITFSKYEYSDGISINWYKDITVQAGGSVKLKVTYVPDTIGFQSVTVKFKTSCKEMQYITITGGVDADGAGYFNY